MSSSSRDSTTSPKAPPALASTQGQSSRDPQSSREAIGGARPSDAQARASTQGQFWGQLLNDLCVGAVSDATAGSGQRVRACLARGQSAGHRFTFTLCWPSGDVIHSFDEPRDVNVERFVQNMEEGLIPNLPEARTDEDCRWRDSYHLVWNDIDLQDGQFFSDYHIPPDAVLTVVRTTIPTPEAGEE